MKPSIKKAMMFAAALVVSVIGQKALAGYKTCYEQEYKCNTRYEQVCSNERECSYIPGGQECHSEQVCHDRPSGPQECRDQQVCHVNPDGSRECHTEQVCRPGSGGGQDCHNEQRCEQTPGRQECRDNYQCRQEPRQECGYETVAKQCWEDDPVPPPYNPPQPPPYYPPVPPPYNPPEPPPYYPPEPPPYNPPQPPVDPNIPAAIGENTVTGLRLKIMANLTAQVVFKDVGQSPAKFKTDYTILVYNEYGELVISEKVASNGVKDQKIALSRRLTLDQDYTLNLLVTRRGGVLPKKYTFQKIFVRPGPNN